MPQTHRTANKRKFAHLRRKIQSKEKEMIMLENQLTETREQKLASEAHCCNLETELLKERDSFAKSFANLKSQKGTIETHVSVLSEQLLEERRVWNKSITDLREQFCKAEKSVMLRIRDLEAECLEKDEELIDASNSIDFAAKLITDLSSENAVKESEICYLRSQIVQEMHSEAGKYAPKRMQQHHPPKVSNESMKSSIIADSLQAGLLNRVANKKQRRCFKMRQTPSKSPHSAEDQTTIDVPLNKMKN